jgi:hypothetical protein
MRAPEQAPERIDGKDGAYTLKHPAYAIINAHRIHGRASLVGSHVDHSGFVRIEIKRADCQVDEFGERFWGGKFVVSVDLSEAQWVALVSRMNMGEGIPCTLRHMQQGELVRVPELTPPIKVDEKLAEQADTHSASIDQLISTQIAALRKAADKLGKKDAERFLMDLRVLEGNLRENAKFHHECLTETKEKLVTEAKLEIEAAINSKITALGIQSLQQLVDATHKQIEGQS